jgi:hypothetical protein
MIGERQTTQAHQLRALLLQAPESAIGVRSHMPSLCTVVRVAHTGLHSQTSLAGKVTLAALPGSGELHRTAKGPCEFHTRWMLCYREG